MKSFYTYILILFAGVGYSQVSPSTGACPTPSCSSNYSASFFDPSVLNADQSLGCGGCGSISQFQFYAGSPANTQISCVCYEFYPTANAGTAPNTNHTINVYSFNSADARTIANVNASTLLSSGSYMTDGSEVDGQINCIELATPATLEAGDDVFLVEFIDPMGYFYHGHLSSTPGNETYVYSPAAGVNDLTPASDFGLADLLLEINGCVGAAAGVPTLSQWGIIIMALTLLIFGVLVLRSRISIPKNNAIIS